MFMQIVENAPNKRQFALAQYCIGLLAKEPRQLWCVPSGQGKGRIEHTTALLALYLGMYSKVHIVYDCEQLKKRDTDDFDGYLGLIEGEVEYHVGIDFVAAEGELVVIDEADALLYNDPVKFRDFICVNACICFTATPDDWDPNGMDSKVLVAMKFAKYHYILNAAEQKIKFFFEEKHHAMPLNDKVALIKKHSLNGPVIVYCDSSMNEELKKEGLEVLVVDENVDHY